MKIAHAADLHLDSPLRGLARYEGAPVERLRGATRRALENLVETCLSEGVELLLLAGDLYDGDWRDYSTGLFFAGQMSRLREAEIAVALVRGNHDAESQITRHLRLPDNVRELPTDHPGTIVFEPLGVAVHGQGYAHRAVTEDLAAGYPPPLKGLLNVALLHTAATGRPGHETYAPCTVASLVDRGHDYWALGHVHQREVLHTDPWVVFPGNLQGRHARETGPKGFTLVTASEGRVLGVEHRSVDVARWEVGVVDAEPAASADDVLDLARAAIEATQAEVEGRTLALRLVITGRSPAHAALAIDPERWRAEIRQAANDLGQGAVWLEDVRFETGDPTDRTELAQRDDAVGHLARALAALAADPAEHQRLAETLQDLDRKLPTELRAGPDGLRLSDPAEIRAALLDVERLLIPRLVGSAEG